MKEKEHFEIRKLQTLGNFTGKWVGFSNKQQGRRETKTDTEKDRF